MWSMKMRAVLSVAALATGVLSMLWATPARAQYSLTRGDVTVYYSAVATTSLDPEVARRYSITRSRSRALLNIVVLRTAGGTMPTPVKAGIRASVTNAERRREELTIREIRDASSISYLAEPRIADVDRLAFELAVTPEGETTPIEVRFDQTFFPSQPR
jgi:ferredoxin-NADP reductase